MAEMYSTDEKEVEQAGPVRLIRRLRTASRPPPFGMVVTRGGALFILGVLLMTLVAIDGHVNLLLLLVGLCAAGLLLHVFSGWLSLRNLAVRRITAGMVHAGQPFVLRYELINRRRFSRIFGIHLIDALPAGARMTPPEAYVPSIEPGEAVTIQAPAACGQRGRLPFSAMAICTRHPFGLFTKYITVVQPDEMIVYPPLGELRLDLQDLLRRSDTAGSSLTPSRRRGDDEFYGVREFRQGDNPRRIHWRRSARTGQLMIREMSEPQGRQFWCVLDTRLASGGPASHERLSSAVSCAATILCHAIEHGVKVGLLCSGEPPLVLPPGGGRAHMPRLLQELALREGQRGGSLLQNVKQVNWLARWRGPCLLIAAQAMPDHAAVVRHLEQRAGPTLDFPADGEAFPQIFQPLNSMHAGRMGNGGPAPTQASAYGRSRATPVHSQEGRRA